MLPFPLTFEEALARLAGNDMIEVRFEVIPNDGITDVLIFPREQIIAMLRGAPEGRIAESGAGAQKLGFGIYVPFTNRERGAGLLFIETAPHAEVPAEEIAAKEQEMWQRIYGS